MPSASARSGPTHVGVFDSGFGGLSVLRALHEALPDARLTYVADSGNAPYGERDEEFVLERSRRIARFLFEQHGAQLLVVACNTATAASVHDLRVQFPHHPIVGVEPGLKPAVEASRRGRVGVMATPGTLRSEKFARLLDAYRARADVHLQPCPGLAGLIERGRLDDPDLLEMLERYCAPLREAGVDVVVLGCTHYAFVAHHIARLLPQVRIVDTAEAVARRARDLALALPATVSPLRTSFSAPLATMMPAPLDTSHDHALRWAADVDARTPGMPAACRLFTTGDPALLQHVMESWLEMPCVAELCKI